MTGKIRKILLAAGAAVCLTGSLALAQQPPAPQPSPVQPRPLPAQPGTMPGQGRPQLPAGHPNVPGLPQRPGGFGQPRPGMPPGFDPRNPHGARRPAAAPVEEEESHAEEHEDPMAVPPPINWWHGILMVNNERAEKGGFLNHLLFRYENPKNPHDPKNEPPPFLASTINFAVLAWILYRFGKKPLAEALVKRRQAIMADIDTATRLKEDAETRLEEYEDKIENIEAKLKEVRDEYAAQAAVEEKHLLAEAEERRVRMRKDAEFRIEQELKAARAELLREAVVNAVAAAEELVAKQIAQKDMDKMSSDYLASIGPALSGVR